MKARFEHALQEAASEFINKESNRTSLITVTRVRVDERGRSAEIYITAFPDTQTAAATDFLNRKKSDFADFLKKRIRLRGLPRVLFLADPERVIEGNEGA